MAAENNFDLDQELRRLESANLSRRLRKQDNRGPARAFIDGREAVLFAGNDYLGLASHPRVIEAGLAALKEYGASATASRLITGNHPLYRKIEENLAAFKGKEAALVFPSGYMANLGLLASMAGPGDTIFMDRLNHASLYDGCRLSGARLRRYRHNDMKHLKQLLAPKTTAPGKKLLITDAVFSMDGDLAPLAELMELARRFGCFLAADDAHGTGVLGPDGKGTAALLGAGLDAEIGTMSKAMGSLGGFVAGSRTLIDYLINKSRTFIFTTGLPPATLASADAAVGLFRDEGWRRERVMELASRTRAGLGDAGFDIPEGVTPIIPLMIGNEEKALRLSALCLKRGIFIPAVRTPAVPRNKARLRMTVSAANSDEDLGRAIDVLTASAGELGII